MLAAAARRRNIGSVTVVRNAARKPLPPCSSIALLPCAAREAFTSSSVRPVNGNGLAAIAKGKVEGSGRWVLYRFYKVNRRTAPPHPAAPCRSDHRVPWHPSRPPAGEECRAPVRGP